MVLNTIEIAITELKPHSRRTRARLFLSNIKNIIVNSISLTIFISAFLLFAQCMSLDPFLFNGSSLDAYQFDSYTGTRECSDAVDSLGPIKSSEIHQYTLQSDAERITAILVSEKVFFRSTDTVVVYFHGRAANIDYYWPRTRLLHATGYPVLVVDYRGFGRSGGRPTEAGIYEDGATALRFVRDSLGNPRVVVHAYSLGSLVGCEVTSKDSLRQIYRFILEAPIGSVKTLVDDGSYLDLPSSYVTTYSGDNTEKIKSINTPLLWLHGTRDETLNRETNGLPIWNNYRGVEGYYVRVEGAGHATIPQTIGYNRYIKALRDFVSGRASQNSLLIAK